jgi:1-aminocyclopropane-1-carboxylate deaminase
LAYTNTLEAFRDGNLSGLQPLKFFRKKDQGLFCNYGLNKKFDLFSILELMLYRETPLQELRNEALDRAGVRLLVKREDLNHPYISGNKWWKLKYNIQQALNEGHDTILTFGGAYSNHIYATCVAANEASLNSIGLIRGEMTLPLNATLSFAETRGMQLHYISRESYRKKNEPAFHAELLKKFGRFYLLPEGGTNSLALKGCVEFAKEQLSAIDYDYLCLAVGTGGTMAGIVSAFKGRKEIIGSPVLKDGNFLINEIKRLVIEFSGESYGNWSLLTSYHHGGYAKVTKALLDFVSAMKDRHDLPLEPVYTAKMMWGLMSEINAGRFHRGSTILALHTGGLRDSG